jgi:hypothetical protein
MWKNFPAPGVQEIHCCGSAVRSSIVVQKTNSESFGQQFWSHLRWWIYVPTELMLANLMQEPFGGNKIGDLTLWIAVVHPRRRIQKIRLRSTSEFPAPLWNTKVHYRVWARRRPCLEPDESNPHPNPISFRSICISSSHIRLQWSSFQAFNKNVCTPCVLHTPPLILDLIIWWSSVKYAILCEDFFHPCRFIPLK